MAEPPPPRKKAPAKRAGSRKTVTAANLEALGAERLAALLVEVAEDQPAIKRRLRMELAGEVGAEDLAAEVGKRLTAIETRRSRVHWRKYREFVRDLDGQRTMITGRLAELDPRLALDFLWRFLGLSRRLMGQLTDRDGSVEAVFRQAVEELGAIAARAPVRPEGLADPAVALLLSDREGPASEGLVAALLPALGPAGAAVLRERLEAAQAARGRPDVGLLRALRQVADAQGDVDAYVATFAPREAADPGAGAEIARRLLAAGRAADALEALARSAPPASARTARLEHALAWEGAYLEALEAAGRQAEAQELRWAAFEERLDPVRLREFVKRLPDFDDVEAEDRAMAHVRGYRSFTRALAFLLVWPSLHDAARMVEARRDEIDGAQTGVLDAAVQALEGRYPLAAVLLVRAQIEAAVRARRPDLNAELERRMDEAEALAGRIEDWRGAESHAVFAERIEKTKPGGGRFGFGLGRRP
jgi:hypothetical protein